MAKSKYEVKIVSYGIYNGWDSNSKDLPKIVRFTEDIPGKIDIEFGMVISIKKAKNKVIAWCIDHPGILDDEGNKRNPFEGEMRIKSQDWKFFLGDTIWNPIEDKIGDWYLSVKLDGKIIAEKTFKVIEGNWSS